MRFKRPTVIESEPAFMNNYTLMGLLVVMIAFMWWSSRSRKKQMEKMEQDKREQLAAVTPGEWVRTRVGFWGRFVDLDGDIVVLETTDGHEMYWEREMIAEIGASRQYRGQRGDRRHQDGGDQRRGRGHPGSRRRAVLQGLRRAAEVSQG